MKKIILNERPEAFFVGYRFPRLQFNAVDLPFPELQPIWQALEKGDHVSALDMVTSELNSGEERTNEFLAALRMAQSAAELKSGDLKRAMRHAGRSLDLHPRQYAANRILLSVLALRKGFAAAYHQLLNLSLPKKTAVWDEIMTVPQIQTALAAWSWQMGSWDDVAGHLIRAYPSGLADMPTPIREEWFRLSLYRGHPEDAAAAAALIIDQEPVEFADELLQTIVQSGWTKEALPLYREAYASV